MPQEPEKEKVKFTAPGLVDTQDLPNAIQAHELDGGRQISRRANTSLMSGACNKVAAAIFSFEDNKVLCSDNMLVATLSLRERWSFALRVS